MHMHLFTCHLLYNGLFSSFSQFVSLTVSSPLTCFLSKVHSLHANGAGPLHHHHHVYLIKNQLKTPRRLVSRAEARSGLEQKRFPHSLPLSLTLTISSSLFLPRSPSLSPPPPKLRPPVYWKLATWFTRTENLIYIFFSSCILSFIY